MKKRIFIAIPSLMLMVVVGIVIALLSTSGKAEDINMNGNVPVNSSGIGTGTSNSDLINPNYSSFFEKSKELAQDKTIIVIVNGEPIYKSNVAFRKESNELSRKNGLWQIENLDITDEEKQKLRDRLENTPVKTEDEILTELIRKKVVLSEAKKQGMTADADTAYEQNKNSFEAMKAAALAENAAENDVQNYRFICEYLDVLEMTEEEYLVEAGKIYEDMITRNNLYISFCEKYSDQKDEATLEQEFEKYVDTLVEEADIEYVE